MSDLNLDKYNFIFKQKVHLWGRITIFAGLLSSFTIPVYLSFIAGYGINLPVLTEGLIFILGIVGFLFIIEPISYFPVLGAIGSYMSFLTGNIGNMRVPVVAAVHSALHTEAGTKKAEISSVFALVGSTITNLLILSIVLIGGTTLIAFLPEFIVDSFSYAIPGIIGAMIFNFGEKMTIKHILAALILSASVMASLYLLGVAIPSIKLSLNIAQIGFAAIFGIFLALHLSKQKKA